MSREKQLVKNTIILGIGQVIPKLTALITLPILTGVLTKAEYGTYDLICTLAVFLMPLVTLQMHQAMFRYIVSTKDKTEHILWITNTYLFAIFMAIVELTICVFILHNVDFGVRIYICIYLFLTIMYNISGQVVRALGFNMKYAISIMIYAVVNMSCIIICTCIKLLSLKTVILSNIIGYGIALGYTLYTIKIWKYFKIKNASVKTAKELLNFSLPIVPSTISLWIVNMSDRFLIKLFLGVEMNAIYAAANKIPSLYSFAYSAFNSAWVESASREANTKDVERYYSKIFDELFDFMAGLMLLLTAITPLLFKLLIANSYIEAYRQIPWLFVGVFFSCIVSFYGGVYLGIQQTKTVGYSSMYAAIINIGVNLIALNKFGLYAASCSTVIAYLVIAIYRACDIQKYINLTYDLKKIMSRSIIIMVSLVLFQCQNRYLDIINVLLGCTFACLFNRSKIMVLVKHLRRRYREKK